MGKGGCSKKGGLEDGEGAGGFALEWKVYGFWLSFSSLSNKNIDPSQLKLNNRFIKPKFPHCSAL